MARSSRASWPDAGLVSWGWRAAEVTELPRAGPPGFEIEPCVGASLGQLLAREHLEPEGSLPGIPLDRPGNAVQPGEITGAGRRDLARVRGKRDLADVVALVARADRGAVGGA